MIEIVEGLKGELVFKSDEEYRKFSEDFTEKVTPELEKWRQVRRDSERESQNRIVD